jgi:tRNA threonylcarbamoyladenosine biosynthesis protein TsaB
VIDPWAAPWSTPGEGAPLVLALDTSSKIGGVALSRGFEVLAEETWLVGGAGKPHGGAHDDVGVRRARDVGSHTQQVLPAAARLCERSGHTIAQLGLIVVALGPGSFTGLRVGASLGKGLSVALGVPLVGVPTLDAIAHQHRTVPGHLVALVDAGRGQVYAGTYRGGTRGLVRRGEYQVLSDEELLAHVGALKGGAWVVGELWPERGRALAALEKVRVATPAGTLRRAALLAELGYARFLRGDVPEPAALQPMYLKRG